MDNLVAHAHADEFLSIGRADWIERILIEIGLSGG
jgi:hypothetical protein